MAIYSGTHGLANGLDIVIDSAEELKKRNITDIKFVLVGQGKTKPGLMAKAKKLGLNNIIFLDPINKNKLARLMKRADIGMQLLANVPAFYYGTSPNKFFDYISASLPVLNNYPGWLADMINEENCGIAIEPDDKVVFADTLIYLSSNRNLLPEMKKSARALAKRQFDREQLSSEFVRWLEKWA